tara:strand:+ start:1308 stop:1703 length:396 start_codon:yes stop_codon:yes gene_type:complete
MVLVLVSILVGVIIFFSSVIAPTVFKAVDEKNAGLFLRAFFPKYYIFGIIITSLALLSAALLEQISNPLELSMISAILAMFIISKLMIPHINKARDMGESAKKKFNQLHLLSVILNFLSLIVGLFLIYLIL